MPSLSIAAVVGDFPTFQVAFGVIEGVRSMPSAPAEIEAFVASAEDAARARLDGGEPAVLPEVLRWRAAYRAFGSKKTSYRDACEALLRRLAAGDHLPRILPLVDLYNAISVKHVVPVGVNDLALLAPPNAFAMPSPATASSTAARRRPRTIRRRRARWFTPIAATASAGGGTGGRTRARGSAPEPGMPWS